jgi:hypothetical protein
MRINNHFHPRYSQVHRKLEWGGVLCRTHSNFRIFPPFRFLEGGRGVGLSPGRKTPNCSQSSHFFACTTMGVSRYINLPHPVHPSPGVSMHQVHPLPPPARTDLQPASRLFTAYLFFFSRFLLGLPPASRLFTFCFFLFPSYSYLVTRPLLSPYSNLRNESDPIHPGSQTDQALAVLTRSFGSFVMSFIINSIHTLKRSLLLFPFNCCCSSLSRFLFLRIKSLSCAGFSRPPLIFPWRFPSPGHRLRLPLFPIQIPPHYVVQVTDSCAWK